MTVVQTCALRSADIAYLLCKEPAVVCGRPWFDACHRALDPSVRIDWRVAEGDRVDAGTVLATLAGRARALVSAERTALNFLQTLSGTATVTAAYVEAVRGTRARILDTRKTIPGLRQAQKYAVRTGGGDNHRMGLFDAVMLKENHVRAAGSLTAAIRAARAQHPALPLIVEVETLAQLEEALQAGCERILIDDFDAHTRREAVRIAAGRIPLEVSGGVDLQTVRAIAADGVDCISIGALTKHVHAIDLSMKLGPAPAEKPDPHPRSLRERFPLPQAGGGPRRFPRFAVEGSRPFSCEAGEEPAPNALVGNVAQRRMKALS